MVLPVHGASCPWCSLPSRTSITSMVLPAHQRCRHRQVLRLIKCTTPTALAVFAPALGPALGRAFAVVRMVPAAGSSATLLAGSSSAADAEASPAYSALSASRLLAARLRHEAAVAVATEAHAVAAHVRLLASLPYPTAASFLAAPAAAAGAASGGSGGGSGTVAVHAAANGATAARLALLRACLERLGRATTDAEVAALLRAARPLLRQLAGPLPRAAGASSPSSSSSSSSSLGGGGGGGAVKGASSPGSLCGNAQARPHHPRPHPRGLFELVPLAGALLGLVPPCLCGGRGAEAQLAGLAWLAALLPAIWPRIPGHADALLAALLRCAAVARLEAAHHARTRAPPPPPSSSLPPPSFMAAAAEAAAAEAAAAAAAREELFFRCAPLGQVLLGVDGCAEVARGAVRTGGLLLALGGPGAARALAFAREGVGAAEGGGGGGGLAEAQPEEAGRALIQQLCGEMEAASAEWWFDVQG